MNELGVPKIGLLPLMLEMYKKYSPELVNKQKPFIDDIEKRLKAFSDVSKAGVCTNRIEIRAEIRKFEAYEIDLMVVIFISYATSMAALSPLLETNIPVLLFSTTPKSSMAEGMSMEDIMLNHGVHGYMDLANVLKRNGRRYFFVSGKKDSDEVYREIELCARVSRVKNILHNSVIGIAGYTFDGMGDLGVDITYLNAALGPEIRHVPLTVIADKISKVNEKELEKEMNNDVKNYNVDKSIDREIHVESNRFYLGLLKIINEFSLNAFTMHFQAILENPDIKTIPFLAISKLQSNGLAYAGEGDLVGATGNLLLRYLFGDTLFTETFCPDFKGGRIVMGHMGESNPAFGKKTVLRRKKFVFGKAIDPVIADVEMQQGRASVLNLGIVENNRFQMIVYMGEICKKIHGSADVDMPYFHFKPDIPLERFLYEYSMAGGTHHIAMTKGDRREELKKLSGILDVDMIILE